jgi:hypothetical protein
MSRLATALCAIAAVAALLWLWREAAAPPVAPPDPRWAAGAARAGGEGPADGPSVPARPAEQPAAASAGGAPVAPAPGGPGSSRAERVERARELTAKLLAQGAPADPVAVRARDQRLLQEERAAAEAAGIDWRLLERMVNDGARAAEAEAR